MNKKHTAVITTACVGAAATAAAFMMSGSGSRSSRQRAKKIKKTTDRALRQVGNIIENVSYMMK